MIAETDVNGRPIAAFKLNIPWKFGDHVIDLIEVPHPKKNKVTIRGFEHFEVVIDISFEDFKKKNPQFTYIETGLSKKLNPELEIEFRNGAIKFHHMRLEKVVEIEQSI
jgi:predicted metalloenzyme YecM